MSQLLVSVINVQEAHIALEQGADILDLKAPDAGALGALPLDVVSDIVRFVNKQKLISATVGDIALLGHADVDAVCERTNSLIQAGVDIVKIGFFEPHQSQHALDKNPMLPFFTQALLNKVQAMCLSKRVKLIAVLFAEHHPADTFIQQLFSSGFQGVMIDTMHKNSKTLFDYADEAHWQNFAVKVRQLQGWFGVAGSLQTQHLARVIRLNPTYVGFRGAVCEALNRKNALSAVKLQQLRKLM